MCASPAVDTFLFPPCLWHLARQTQWFPQGANIKPYLRKEEIVDLLRPLIWCSNECSQQHDQFTDFVFLLDLLSITKILNIANMKKFKSTIKTLKPALILLCNRICCFLVLLFVCLQYSQVSFIYRAVFIHSGTSRFFKVFHICIKTCSLKLLVYLPKTMLQLQLLYQ